MNINASELTKIEAAAVAPNRRYLVTGHRDKQLYYLDLETKKQTRIRANPKTYATAIAVSEDSRLIATGGFHDAVRIFNAKTKKKILNIKGDTDYSVVTDLVFSADGKYLAGAFGDYDRYLQVWEVKTGKHVFFTHVETEVFNIVFSSSGKEIIGASQYGEILSVWDIATEEQVQGLGKRDNLWALNLAKNHSGSTIAVVTNRSKVIMWDIATKKEQAEISLTPSNCVSIPLICFSADDKKVAVTKTDVIKIVDLELGKELHNFYIDDTFFTTIKFLENDTKLLTVSRDGLIKLWDLRFLSNNAT